MNQPASMSPEATLEKLEFPQILERLARECRFSVSAQRAREIGPSSDPTQVRFLLDVTAEAVDLQTNFPQVTVGGARDIRPLMERAEKGGRLNPAELLEISDTLAASRVLKRAIVRLPEPRQRFPNLFDAAEHLADLPDLESRIGGAIGPRGDVMDTASEALSRIRREVRVAHSRLMDRVNSMISGGRFATALQDAIVTMRDGRYVIPVRADARAQVPGVVHDTSSSGQTVFVEPFDVVELNNKWREAQIREAREIERILDELSQRVGSYAREIELAVEAIAALDLAMAKARLAFAMRANRPGIWTGGANSPSGHPTHRIDLRRARHPLLDPQAVVPIDVTLGEDFRVLLITGPNTGGKTVSLKTIGLLTLMTQCGLFIPAEDTSVMSVFPAIFVDIGDEQSIAQSLSTFSAHLRNIIRMLDGVDSESLVLLDELGAGTDPGEGSALARALISELLDRQALVVATTHYSEVKAYAFETAGVENASVEFDVASLAPTYRLMVGVPGQSNALAIAQRLGMPIDIVNRARALIDPEEVRADRLLADIRTRRDEADRILEQARTTEQVTRALREQAREEASEASRQREAAYREALAAAEGELEAVRQMLRRLERDRETGAIEREQLQQRKQEVEAVASSVRTFRKERLAAPKPQPGVRIEAGDRVEITSLGQEGEVIAVAGDHAEVQVGALKVRQPLSSLKRLGRRHDPPARTVFKPASSGPVPLELDLRGERAVDVEAILDRYLDEASRAGIPIARIIHGKGSGALRQVVREIVKSSPAVVRWEHPPLNQGGDGVTILYFRD